MGSENLFHKRKAKNANDFKRNKAKRAPYDHVLIVCEGEKTEPFYLKALVQDLRLNSANVEICGKECGSHPNSVFQFAKDRLRRADTMGDAYDRIFCVFDKDAHQGVNQVISEIHRHKLIESVVSMPCFEFWLLLHFDYTERPFSATGDRSVCDVVIAELRAHIKNYRKKQPDIYFLTKPMIKEAIAASKAVYAYSGLT